MDKKKRRISKIPKEKYFIFLFYPWRNIIYPRYPRRNILFFFLILSICPGDSMDKKGEYRRYPRRNIIFSILSKKKYYNILFYPWRIWTISKISTEKYYFYILSYSIQEKDRLYPILSKEKYYFYRFVQGIVWTKSKISILSMEDIEDIQDIHGKIFNILDI